MAWVRRHIKNMSTLLTVQFLHHRRIIWFPFYRNRYEEDNLFWNALINVNVIALMVYLLLLSDRSFKILFHYYFKYLIIFCYLPSYKYSTLIVFTDFKKSIKTSSQLVKIFFYVTLLNVYEEILIIVFRRYI